MLLIMVFENNLKLSYCYYIKNYWIDINFRRINWQHKRSNRQLPTKSKGNDKHSFSSIFFCSHWQSKWWSMCSQYIRLWTWIDKCNLTFHRNLILRYSSYFLWCYTLCQSYNVFGINSLQSMSFLLWVVSLLYLKTENQDSSSLWWWPLWWNVCSNI